MKQQCSAASTKSFVGPILAQVGFTTTLAIHPTSHTLSGRVRMPRTLAFSKRRLSALAYNLRGDGLGAHTSTADTKRPSRCITATWSPVLGTRFALFTQ